MSKLLYIAMTPDDVGNISLSLQFDDFGVGGKVKKGEDSTNVAKWLRKLAEDIEKQPNKHKESFNIAVGYMLDREEENNLYYGWCANCGRYCGHRSVKMQCIVCDEVEKLKEKNNI